MNDAAQLFHDYGVPGIALIVFAKRMGVPIPAMPLFLLAGARGAHDAAFALNAAIGACMATVAADALWFAGGRRFGPHLLALICRISISPDTCIRKSDLRFARHGAVTVLLAKFIPGVAGLAPPLAGALGMPATKFTALNFAGTLLWVGSGVAAGWLLPREVSAVVRAGRDLGGLALALVLLALGAFLAWLCLRRVLTSWPVKRPARPWGR